MRSYWFEAIFFYLINNNNIIFIPEKRSNVKMFLKHVEKNLTNTISLFYLEKLTINYCEIAVSRKKIYGFFLVVGSQNLQI